MFLAPLKFVRRQWIARPLAVLTICFVLGMFCREAFSLRLPVTIALLGGCILGYVLLRKRQHVFPILLAAAFLLGYGRIQIAQLCHPDVPELFSVEFEGQVVSDPIYNAESERIICEFQLHTLNGKENDHRVRLYLRSDVVPLEGIAYGQQLSCFGHVWPQDHATNPHQFDVQNWLLSDGMTGMASAKLEEVTITESSAGFDGWLIGLRHAISDRIDVLFPKNPDLARALILGDRSGLSSELRDNFSETGITHLICISGMHISVLATAISALLRKFMRRNAAVGTTIAAVFLYGLLIGFPASLVRATIMFSVLSLAPLFGRYSDSPTRLCAALLGMLIYNPFYLYDGGFVLSFSATAGILLLEPPISALFRVDSLKHVKPHPNRLLNLGRSALYYFPKLLCATLAAQLATLPFVIDYFGGQSLLSLPVNLFAIPLTMFAYPVILAATCISFLIFPAGNLVALFGDFMLSCLIELVQFCAQLTFGQLRSPSYPAWLFWLHWILLIGASDLCKTSISIRRWLPVSLPVLASLSILASFISSLGFRVIFLDADQADAAVVRAEGKVYIFDAGEEYSPITDYVTASCTDVDAVFLSHPHYDHVVGLAELLPLMQPDVIYVPNGWFEVESSATVMECVNLARSMEIPFVELSVGDEVALSENVSVRVYSPDGVTSDVNDLSLLLELSYYDTGVFFTGDVTIEGEPENLPDVDILKVPHHGSGSSTSERFLEDTSPAVSIISVGENNYGHPSDKVLDKLAAINTKVYRTDQCGAITVHVSRDGEIRVDTYLSPEESE